MNHLTFVESNWPLLHLDICRQPTNSAEFRNRNPASRWCQTALLIKGNGKKKAHRGSVLARRTIVCKIDQWIWQHWVGRQPPPQGGLWEHLCELLQNRWVLSAIQTWERRVILSIVLTLFWSRKTANPPGTVQVRKISSSLAPHVWGSETNLFVSCVALFQMLQSVGWDINFLTQICKNSEIGPFTNLFCVETLYQCFCHLIDVIEGFTPKCVRTDRDGKPGFW